MRIKKAFSCNPFEDTYKIVRAVGNWSAPLNFLSEAHK